MLPGDLKLCVIIMIDHLIAIIIVALEIHKKYLTAILEVHCKQLYLYENVKTL